MLKFDYKNQKNRIIFKNLIDYIDSLLLTYYA